MNAAARLAIPGRTRFNSGMLSIMLLVLADVTADGGFPRGPLTIRADGRLAYGPNGLCITESKEGLERLQSILDAVTKNNRSSLPVQIVIEKDADAKSTRLVLDHIRSVSKPLSVPSPEWRKDAFLLKGPDFTIVFQFDPDAPLNMQSNSRLILNEAQAYRHRVLTAYKQGVRNANQEEIDKARQSLDAATNLYRFAAERLKR